jgi:hypothetical protein
MRGVGILGGVFLMWFEMGGILSHSKRATVLQLSYSEFLAFFTIAVSDLREICLRSWLWVRRYDGMVGGWDGGEW